jgi:PAS domain S-box-containing protein
MMEGSSPYFSVPAGGDSASQQAMASHSGLAASLITPLLTARQHRPPDFAAEATVFRRLGEQMGNQSEHVLATLLEGILQLTHGDSVGIALAEREEGQPLLRFVAVAGALAAMEGETVNGELCSLLLQDAQLMRQPGRWFECLGSDGEQVEEFLSVPLRAAPGTVGALWIACQPNSHELGPADLRVLNHFAGFALAATRQAGLLNDYAVARLEARAIGHRLGVLLESITDGLAFLDEQSCFLFANQSLARLLHKEEAELLGFSLTDVFPHECRSKVEGALRACARERKHVFLQCSLIERGRLLEVNLYPESTGGVCLLISDVSDRRRAEIERMQLLARTQAYAQQLKGLAGAAESIASAPDLHTTLDVIARHAALIVGSHSCLASIEQSERMGKIVARHESATRSEGGEPAAATNILQVPLVGKDGARFGEILLRDKIEGGFTGEDESVLIQLGHLASSALEKARAEEALRESRQRLKIAVEAGCFGIFDLDLRDGAITGSRTFRRALGLDDGGHQTLGDVLPRLYSEDRHLIRAAFRQALRRRDRYQVECRYLNAEGRLRWLAVFGSILLDGSDRPHRVIGVVSDVTERKQIEEELRSINQTLEQRVEKRTAMANRRAEQLSDLALQLTRAEQRERRRIAQILHDHLQQILVAAKLRLGMVGDQALQQAHKDSLHQVADLLSRAIEASRDLTVELSPPILFDGGLGAGLEWLSRRIKDEQGLEVHVDADGREELDTYMKAFLFQTTRELLFNVVKHAGVLEAWVRMEVGHDGEVRIEVRDRGRGFRSGKMESSAGAGFGLSSLRERMSLLGGRLSIRSEPGEGTSILLVAPPNKVVEEDAATRDLLDILTTEDRRSAVSPPDEVGGKPERSLRVLLADDHKILREGLVGLLEEQPGMHVVGEASDGQMAVDLALREKPDVIIMDITMPRLNGIDATRQIVGQWPEAVVIGLSMHDKADMAQAITDAGAKAYVTKGAPSEILVETIWSFAPFQRA